MWVLCHLTVFRNANQQLFPIFACNTCESMKCVSEMALNQNEIDIENLKCLHSKTVDPVALTWGAWQNLWPVNYNAIINNNVQSFKVWCNDHISHETMLEDDLFLAVVQKKQKISVLCTLREGFKQKTLSSLQPKIRVVNTGSNSSIMIMV